ncbi:acyltransferase family protein [Rhizobium ruizarguesonis]|uniref:acyltransferase family protein n=1 Tax=Rhizobium ruizarguesonis TaxID=2081791 RepID=UPI0010320E3B|nr:acyltransferase [Rhizobium ruizarguesonis]TAZ71696.1 acyltransferase [Rhizobium ruizarguesonis]TAZ98369.1 acyltransferase [Rhizobium ruizarguesonis]TBA14972.1 acyltransferase [Rhizobium ruizarguesonis]TBB85772.1 acyltransferase [Rhizobium ruizarguesonis]TBC19145.1 acyltransferase [Rhizobium ruizarguesonis]
MRNRENNFDCLRQFAAFLVIIGHSQSLTGAAHTGLWGHGIATVGVLIFFGLSGYLVAQSWERDPVYISFIAKRSLRIFPALALCVLLCVFVLGPILSTSPAGEYFQNPNTQNYFWNIVLLPRYNLPGVFADNTYPYAVNGSLWSLPVEFACYLLIALIGFGRGKARPLAVLLLCFILIGINLWYSHLYQGAQIVIWGTDLGQATSIMPFFMVGALLCVSRDRIALRWDVALGMALALTALQLFVPSFPIDQITWIFVPYIVLTIGWSRTPVLHRFGRFGDPSYGMYLYAFPVQQMLVYFSGNKIDFVILTLLTTIIVAVLGLLSWHLLEKPAMTLKSKIGPSSERFQREGTSV